MKSLEKLTDELQIVESTKEGNLFHSVMADLLGRIGFSERSDTYGLTVNTWVYDTEGKIIPMVSSLQGFNLEQLELFNMLIGFSNFPVQNFTRMANYLRNDGVVFDIATFYDNFANMKNGAYLSRFIRSNSKLSSAKKVVDFNLLKNDAIPRGDNSFLIDIVLENDGILKRNDDYLFTPSQILGLVDSEPKVVYAKLVSNNDS